MNLKQVNLTRSGQKILNDLNLDIPERGVMVLLGANGAGKSTLLNVLAGISDIDSGEIILKQARHRFLMPEPAVFYPQLTVEEQLRFIATINHVNAANDEVKRLLDLWQLMPVKQQLTQHLSLGFRQRLSLAQLEVSQADVLLMDEPLNGMDPEVLKIFKTQVKHWKSTKTIVMATHIMHEVQELADWVVVMWQGNIIHSAAYQQELDFYQIYQHAIDQHHKTFVGTGSKNSEN